MVIAFGIWCSIVYALAQYELAGPFVLLTVFMCLVYFGTSSGRQRKKTETEGREKVFDAGSGCRKEVHQLIGTPSHYIIGIVKFIYQIGAWSPLEKSTVQAMGLHV